MIRISICDDQEIMLNRISTIVDEAFLQHTDKFSVMKFFDGERLLQEHNKEKFDIIFLDIDMPKISGFDVARKLRDEFCNCFVIFVTSHTELVFESFGFQPFEFIRKSTSESMEKHISVIVKKLMIHMKQNDVIWIDNITSEANKIFIRDILYIESEGHYLKYHVINKSEPIVIRCRIKEKQEEYKEYDFVRIHKKYLANMRHIMDLDTINETVRVKGNHRLSLSRSLKNDAEQKYRMYLRTKT